jgi:peptidyl-tRNA hydrolase
MTQGAVMAAAEQQRTKEEREREWMNEYVRKAKAKIIVESQ